MTHHRRPAEPPSAHGDAERKLVRPTEGRVVAGVAAGLARYFGISPVVYRVAFAALVLLGGSGLILYAAAWLVIPDERRGASVVEEAIRDRRRPALARARRRPRRSRPGLGHRRQPLLADPGRGWLPALAVGLAIVWWQLQDRGGRSHRCAGRRRRGLGYGSRPSRRQPVLRAGASPSSSP